MSTHPAAVSAPIALICVMLCGCGPLDAERSSYLTYDKARDEFGHLRIYRHIQAANGESRDLREGPTYKGEYSPEKARAHLAALWKLRDRCVLTPFPEFMRMMELHGVVFSPRTFASIDLNKAPPDSSLAEETTLPLDQIVIRPGELFVSPDKTLCYYHRCYFPGTFIDRALDVGAEAANRELTSEFQVEQKARKQAPGPRSTWANMRWTLDAYTFNSTPYETDPRYVPRMWRVLDAESLRLLVAQAEKRQLKLTRTRERLACQFQLSQADAAEFPALWQAFLDHVKRMHKEINEPPGALLRLDTALKKIELKTDPEGRVSLSVDLSTLFPLIAAKDYFSEQKKSLGREFLVELRRVPASDKGYVPINETITYEKVLSEFAKSRP